MFERFKLLSIFPLLFPIAANLLAATLVIYRKKTVIRTILISNLISSLLFGISISIKVFYTSTEPSLWPMPLIFAPLEYWIKFGAFIFILAVVLIIYAYFKKK